MAATASEIARALAGGAPVRWRLLNCDRRGNLRALGDSTTADLSDALLWESGANPGLDGGRLDLDNDGREIPMTGAVRLDLARVPGGAGLGDISHVRLIEDRLVQPGGAGIRYETALTYWQRQAEQASGGGLWALSAAVGDALDASGHGNDGTVTYAEGQRGVDGLYDRSDGAMAFEEGTVNLISDPRGAGTGTGWFNPAAVGISRTSTTDDKAPHGTAHLVESLGDSPADARLQYSYNVSAPTAGMVFSAQVLVRAASAAEVGKAVRLFVGEHGGASGTQSTTTADLVLTEEYQALEVSRTIVQNDRTVVSWQLTMRNGGPGGAWLTGDGYLATNCQLEAKSRATSYCDGSLGTGYSWASTAHASASTRVASSVNLGSGDELDDIFDGGGAVGCVFNLTGAPAESTTPRLADKGNWALYVDSGSRTVYLNRTFSGGLAQWRSSLGAITFGVPYALVVLYDDSATANDPVMYLANLDTGVLTQLTITETVAPSGTANSDTSVALYVGNNITDIRAFNGVIDLVRIWQGTQPTEDEIEEFFALAQTARPTYTPAPAPEWVEFPRGIFVVSFADTTHPWDGRPIATLTLNDLAAHLLDTIGEAYTAAAGTAYWDVVRELLEDYLGLLTDLPSGGPLLQQDFSRPRSWRFIDALRDLADGLNYHPVWPTALGRFTSRERVNLALATAAVDYSDAQEPRMLDAGAPYVRKLDVPQVDNRRVVVADFGAEHIADPKYVIYENADPTSPVSTALTPVRLGDLRADTRPSTRAIYDKPTMAAIAQYELRLLDARARGASFDTFPDPRRANHEYYRVTVAGAETSQLVRCSGWSQALQPGAPMTHHVQIVRPVSLTELFEIEEEGS